MRDVTVVGLDSIEDFITMLAFNFSNATFVCDVSFSTGKFLK